MEEIEVEVEYQYDPEEKDEIQLYEGDILRVVEQNSDGWWYGYLKYDTQCRGLFPANYVRIIEEATEEIDNDSQFNHQQQYDYNETNHCSQNESEHYTTTNEIQQHVVDGENYDYNGDQQIVEESNGSYTNHHYDGNNINDRFDNDENRSVQHSARELEEQNNGYILTQVERKDEIEDDRHNWHGESELENEIASDSKENNDNRTRRANEELINEKVYCKKSDSRNQYSEFETQENTQDKIDDLDAKDAAQGNERTNSRGSSIYEFSDREITPNGKVKQGSIRHLKEALKEAEMARIHAEEIRKKAVDDMMHEREKRRKFEQHAISNLKRQEQAAIKSWENEQFIKQQMECTLMQDEDANILAYRSRVFENFILFHIIVHRAAYRFRKKKLLQQDSAATEIQRIQRGIFARVAVSKKQQEKIRKKQKRHHENDIVVDDNMAELIAKLVDEKLKVELKEHDKKIAEMQSALSNLYQVLVQQNQLLQQNANQFISEKNRVVVPTNQTKSSTKLPLIADSKLDKSTDDARERRKNGIVKEGDICSTRLPVLTTNKTSTNSTKIPTLHTGKFKS